MNKFLSAKRVILYISFIINALSLSFAKQKWLSEQFKYAKAEKIASIKIYNS